MRRLRSAAVRESALITSTRATEGPAARASATEGSRPPAAGADGGTPRAAIRSLPQSPCRSKRSGQSRPLRRTSTRTWAGASARSNSRSRESGACRSLSCPRPTGGTRDAVGAPIDSRTGPPTGLPRHVDRRDHEALADHLPGAERGGPAQAERCRVRLEVRVGPVPVTSVSTGHPRTRAAGGDRPGARPRGGRMPRRARGTRRRRRCRRSDPGTTLELAVRSPARKPRPSSPARVVDAETDAVHGIPPPRVRRTRLDAPALVPAQGAVPAEVDLPPRWRGSNSTRKARSPCSISRPEMEPGTCPSRRRALRRRHRGRAPSTDPQVPRSTPSRSIVTGRRAGSSSAPGCVQPCSSLRRVAVVMGLLLVWSASGRASRRSVGFRDTGVGELAGIRRKPPTAARAGRLDAPRRAVRVAQGVRRADDVRELEERVVCGKRLGVDDVGPAPARRPPRRASTSACWSTIPPRPR